MSGGSWDYLYERVQDAASRMAGDKSPLRRAFAAHLGRVADALHDIEWVDSGDYAYGDDVKAIDTALGDSRKAILAQMIEEARKAQEALATAIRAAEAAAKGVSHD